MYNYANQASLHGNSIVERNAVKRSAVVLKKAPSFLLYDCKPDRRSIYQEVLCGLEKEPKELNAKFNYDERGSQLFEEICRTPEYYLTRTELTILRENRPELATLVEAETALIEFGSGSGGQAPTDTRPRSLSASRPSPAGGCGEAGRINRNGSACNTTKPLCDCF